MKQTDSLAFEARRHGLNPASVRWSGGRLGSGAGTPWRRRRRVNGAPVVLRARASAADGKVVSVHFYAGSTLLGVDAVVPYRLHWRTSVGSTYEMTAVTTDDGGARATSAVLRLKIRAKRGRR